MIINLSRVDFGGVTGGKAKPEETFDVQPTTAEQTITPTAGSVFSGGTVHAVTSEIDVNIVSNNIKEGVSILGVAGSLKGGKPEETFNIQPTTSDQTITPTEGSVFSGGTVKAVTSAIDNNIQPENIKEGVSILGVEGTLSGGGGSDVFVVPDGVKFSKSTITEVPSNWDFSNVSDMSNMFNDCSKLTTVPPLITSNVTNMGGMFINCSNLTTIPHLVTSNVTNMNAMLLYCSNLTTIPHLVTSKVSNMGRMFSGCSRLTTVPPLITSNVTNMDDMFYGCSRLKTVEGIDFSGLTAGPALFGWNSGSSVTRFIVNGKINVSISDNNSIKALTAIDYDSVKSILAAADRTDNTNAKELAFNRTMTDQNGELAALVSSCTTKGWTITGLTLQ